MFVGVNVTMLHAVRDGMNLTDPATMADALLIGLIAGLVASGFYSTTKAATR